MVPRTRVVLFLVVCLVCLVSWAPFVLSAWKDQQIKVSYRNIKMVVDGKTVSSDTEPFIYEGRTFVPLRAISEALGKDVTWDAATYTVRIGGSSSTTPNTGNSNLVLDNMRVKTSSFTAQVVGTITNKSDSAIGGITITFNLFDAVGSPIGTAFDYLAKDEPLAPGAQWLYEATYLGDDSEQVNKAVLASIIVD